MRNIKALCEAFAAIMDALKDLTPEERSKVMSAVNEMLKDEHTSKE